MRQVITASLLVLLAGRAALAGDLPDGVGVITANGSVFTTDISPAGDTDDYVFQGFPGMTVTASVKLAKGSTLVPNVQILRPGGAVLSEEDGVALTLTSKSATAKVTLDATGWWKVRVLGTGGSVGTYSVSVKYTAPVLPTLPALAKNFKMNASISPVGDTDDFPFQGYTGQTISASLTVPKTSALDPILSLIRPDGSVAVTMGQGTLEKSLTLKATFDADGPWHLRVVGESPTPTQADPHPAATTGPYALSVIFGKPPVVGLTPDSNGQYRIALPAIGGATIGYSLKFTGTAPTFNSLIDPNGHQVIGFPGGTTVKAYGLLPSLPIGDYELTFDAPAGTPPTRVTCTRTLKLPKGAAKRTAKLSATEPVITYNTSNPNSINPPAGGPGTVVQFQTTNPIDANSPTGKVAFYLGHTPMTGVSLLPDQRTVQGTVPDSVAQGVYDVVVFSTSGQPDAVAGAFTIVPPPQVSDIDPRVGPSGGNFPVVITGENFRAGKMGIMIDGALTAVTPTAVTDTTVTFLAPSWAPTTVTFGVQDRGTQLRADLPINSFEYTATAAISRIVPSLIPTLGNELITIQGANFAPTDKVYLENDPAIGGFQEITATQATYVSVNKHAFMAPPRSKHTYAVYVTDQFGQPTPHKTRPLTYYSFADFTVSTNLGSIGADKYDGWTTAMGDYDKDNDQDLFISRRGDPADTDASATSLTRVLRNDGNGQFTDVTASVMPATGVDDWRADRIWCTDVNQDGYVDLVLTTNTVAVPTAGLSHVRILVNEQRGGTGANAQDRVFRDRTIDLMAPPRTMQKYGYFGGSSEVYASDDWRGLDMWVGDLDKGAAGPPEIVITHDEVKDDDNPNADVFSSGVYCGNYCSSNGAQQSFAYAYTFYWGGSRMFVWDKSARSGQGRYKFDPTFFPRKSGPVVPQGGVPGGGQIPACSPHYNSICKGVFTPFTGKRLAVGTLDGDTKPDVAVLSDQVIQKRAKVNDTLMTTSSLQVGINKTSAGFGITDLTDVIFALGGDTKGDAVAIGQPGYPDGNSYGVIAISKASAGNGGSVLRLIKFKPSTAPGGVGDFEDISAALPAADANEKYQASRIAWIDIDQDGDQDLVLVAPAAPGGTQPALRILRNERQGSTVGLLKRTLDPLLAAIVTSTEHFEGDALTIGDITGDGLLDYIVTRATPSGSGSQTRIVKTDK
jgi:hypothetical protein